jgi:hypothetical protein
VQRGDHHRRGKTGAEIDGGVDACPLPDLGGDDSLNLDVVPALLGD